LHLDSINPDMLKNKIIRQKEFRENSFRIILCYSNVAGNTRQSDSEKIAVVAEKIT